jgi:hypothetical protein
MTRNRIAGLKKKRAVRRSESVAGFDFDRLTDADADFLFVKLLDRSSMRSRLSGTLDLLWIWKFGGDLEVLPDGAAAVYRAAEAICRKYNSRPEGRIAQELVRVFDDVMGRLRDAQDDVDMLVEHLQRFHRGKDRWDLFTAVDDDLVDSPDEKWQARFNKMRKRFPVEMAGINSAKTLSRLYRRWMTKQQASDD